MSDLETKYALSTRVVFDRIFGSEVQFGGSVLKYAFPGPFKKPTGYENSNIFQRHSHTKMIVI